MAALKLKKRRYKGCRSIELFKSHFTFIYVQRFSWKFTVSVYKLVLLSKVSFQIRFLFNILPANITLISKQFVMDCIHVSIDIPFLLKFFHTDSTFISEPLIFLLFAC